MKSCKGCKFYSMAGHKCRLLNTASAAWNCCNSHEDRKP